MGVERPGRVEGAVFDRDCTEWQEPERRHNHRGRNWSREPPKEEPVMHPTFSKTSPEMQTASPLPYFPFSGGAKCRSQLRKLSPRGRLAELIVLRVPELTSDLLAFVEEEGIGGVELTRFTSVPPKTSALLITRWSGSMRLPGVPRVPRYRTLKRAGEEYWERVGHLVGQGMRALGFDACLVPHWAVLMMKGLQVEGILPIPVGLSSASRSRVESRELSVLRKMSKHGVHPMVLPSCYMTVESREEALAHLDRLGEVSDERVLKMLEAKEWSTQQTAAGSMVTYSEGMRALRCEVYPRALRVRGETSSLGRVAILRFGADRPTHFERSFPEANAGSLEELGDRLDLYDTIILTAYPGGHHDLQPTLIEALRRVDLRRQQTILVLLGTGLIELPLAPTMVIESPEAVTEAMAGAARAVLQCFIR